MNELWRSVILKIERAEAQSILLAKSIEEWSVRNTFETEISLRPGRLGMKVVLKEFRESPPFDEWALIFGECIHNLRSSLDNLAFGLARLKKDPPSQPKTIAFPIFKDKEDFERNGRRSLKQLPEDASNLIERLQPFQRDGSEQFGRPEDDFLLKLQLFNNLDKHQVPSMTLVAPSGMELSIHAEFYSDDHTNENVPPNVHVWSGPLSPGAVLVEYITTQPIKSGNLDIKGGGIVSVSGLEAPVPVALTLVAIQQYVHLVASQFHPFFELSGPAGN